VFVVSELRQKQKEKRERDILAAAARLLSEKGFQATSVEEIAELAEVGVATVYNYFNTKADVVMALLNNELKELLEGGQRIVRRPPADAAEAVYRLINSYTVSLAVRHPKRLLREVFALVFSEQAFYRKEMFKFDFRLIDQLAELIEGMKKRRQLVRGVNTGDAAMILYTVGMTGFTMFVADEDMTLDAMKKATRRHVRLVFSGLAPDTGGGNDDKR
jgi:AcrR family transcriptional regulator